MLMRFDPFREFERLSQQSLGRPQAAMPIDAYRQGDSFVVHFDVPGVSADAIDLTVEKNVLTVTAERSWERKDGQEVLVSERPQGRFTRQLLLSDTLDSDRIEASYDNGVLTVRLPVAERAKARKVEIASGDTGQAIEATSSAA